MNAQQIVKHFGGELQAALALGKTQNTIKNWLDGSKIPVNTQNFIQTITGGKLKADHHGR